MLLKLGDGWPGLWIVLEHQVQQVDQLIESKVLGLRHAQSEANVVEYTKRYQTFLKIFPKLS